MGATIGYKCAVCHKGESEKDVKQCSVCLSVLYCSVECQKAHRAKHRPDCQPWRRYDGIVTRFVFDGRDYDATSPWLAQAKELRAGICKANASSADELEVTPEAFMMPGGDEYVRFLYPNDIETVGDLLRRLFPDGVVMCHPQMFACLMSLRPATPVRAASLGIRCLPFGAVSLAQPRSAKLRVFLQRYFKGVDKLWVSEVSPTRHVLLLPDGPVFGNLSVILPEMVDVYVDLADTHPGQAAVVTEPEFKIGGRETTAGQALVYMLSTMADVQFEQIRTDPAAQVGVPRAKHRSRATCLHK